MRGGAPLLLEPGPAHLSSRNAVVVAACVTVRDEADRTLAALAGPGGEYRGGQKVTVVRVSHHDQCSLRNVFE